MKPKNKLVLAFGAILLNAGLISTSFAQRNHDDHGGDRGSGQSQHADRSSTQRVSPERNSNSNSHINPTYRPPASRDNSVTRTAPQNNTVTRNNSYQNNNNVSRAPYNRVNRSTTVNNTTVNRTVQYRNNNSVATRSNGYQNNRTYPSIYNNNTRHYNYSSSRYITWRPNYKTLPHTYVSINFGGRPYYYSSGYFYDYYDGYYRPFFPPRGIRINFLPYGYYPFYVGPDMYYFSNGIYYRRYDDTNYEVVDAPMGAQVPSLPTGAKSVVLNGEKFYELNGTYYKEGTDANGNVVYIVVGKHGEINNSDDQAQADNSAPLKPGDVVAQLPPDSKKVQINGEQFYVTPDDVYLREEKSDNNTVTYRVVGAVNN